MRTSKIFAGSDMNGVSRDSDVDHVGMVIMPPFRMPMWSREMPAARTSVSSQTIGEVSPATKVTGVTLWVKATEPDFVKSSGTLIVMEANDVLGRRPAACRR
jgi:hypothetical protein